MVVRVVRLGSDRIEGEGTRIGTVRRPPRGVPRSQYARRNFYDVWLPDLAPSSDVVADYQRSKGTEADWRRLERRSCRQIALP